MQLQPDGRSERVCQCVCVRVCVLSLGLIQKAWEKPGKLCISKTVHRGSICSFSSKGTFEGEHWGKVSKTFFLFHHDNSCESCTINLYLSKKKNSKPWLFFIGRTFHGLKLFNVLKLRRRWSTLLRQLRICSVTVRFKVSPQGSGPRSESKRMNGPLDVCVCAFVFGWKRRDGAAFTELTEESTDTLSLHLDSIKSETVKLWVSPANNINISYISKHRFHFP